MSQPANPSATPEGPAREEPSGLSTFTLQIISPSSEPLCFPNLPVTTTVKQLKAKIRNELSSNPADDHQRIIYRGRMLAIETATMIDVFGKEALATQEPQNLHLVLRQTAPDASTSQNSTLPTAAPPQAPPTIPNPPLVPQLINRPQSTPAGQGPAMPGMQAQQPLPGFQQMQQNQALHQMAQMHNVMTQRLQQLHQESQRLHQEMSVLQARTAQQQQPLFNDQQPPVGQSPMPQQGLFRMPLAPHMAQTIPQTLQNLINQQQRERAAEGRHGAQDGGTNPHSSQPASGRASPNILPPQHLGATTYTREGVGPNGERINITVNQTTTFHPYPHQHHHHSGPHANPALEIQAVLRNADRLMAARNAQNNMQRSASNPIPAQAGPSSTANPPGVVRSGTPGPVSVPATTNASPSVSTILSSPLNTATQSGTFTTSTSNPSDATVYLLSSPSGPRALLVANSETYFTPRQSRRHSPVGAQGQAIGAPAGLPEFRNRPAGRPARRNQRPLQPVNIHGNPGAAGAGAMAARLGPLLWLFVRLIGFIWFFTAGNPSWTRWLMVTGIATLIFLFNTGVFNGVAEQVLGPVRRHLEGLIPLGPAPVAPGRGAPDAVQAGQDPVAEEVVVFQANGQARRFNNRQPRQPEPDPAQVAARLLEQRRQADRGWLMEQFRRAEHALLLFLASLVPGVGERHIAAREAEANAAEAERRRLIQEAETANAAENTENAENTGNNEDGSAADAENSGEHQEHQEPQENQQENAAAPAQPLIEV